MAIEQYVARHVAPAVSVLHEIRSELVHVDVHVVPPEAGRSYWFLFTTGMSALPMRVPQDMGLVPHAELSLMLPSWWQVDLENWRCEPNWFWPIRELQALARYPHRHQTWLGEGHTIASSDPPRRYDASTELSAMLILPFSQAEDEEPSVIDGVVATELLTLWPLYTEELEYKRTKGARALCELLDTAGVSPVLDPARPSALVSGGARVSRG